VPFEGGRGKESDIMALINLLLAILGGVSSLLTAVFNLL
jgi:hypothetical protein